MWFLLIFALVLIALVGWILWRTRGRSMDPGDNAKSGKSAEQIRHELGGGAGGGGGGGGGI